MTESFNVVRLNSDGAGESYFDSYKFLRVLQDFAPPAPPLFVSPFEEASAFAVICLPAGWIGEPHPSPNRQIMFCLSGSLRVTASDGNVRTIEAGNALLMADTWGKGHKSEVISRGPVEAVVIKLPVSNRDIAEIGSGAQAGAS